MAEMVSLIDVTSNNFVDVTVPIKTEEVIIKDEEYEVIDVDDDGVENQTNLSAASRIKDPLNRSTKMGEKKRTRSPNYTNEEINVLLNIIAQYKSIIENKKTNATTWREKDTAWKQIADMFNVCSPGSVHRTVDSLKKVYENKKKDVRRAVSLEKNAFKQTGRGTATFVTDRNQELALSLINEKAGGGTTPVADLNQELALSLLTEKIGRGTTAIVGDRNQELTLSLIHEKAVCGLRNPFDPDGPNPINLAGPSNSPEPVLEPEDITMDQDRELPYLSEITADTPYESITIGQDFTCSSEKAPYKCTTCEKVFSSKSTLTRHTLLHQYSYRCKLCYEKCFTKFRYQIHLRSHLSQKSYKCEECQKCFTKSSNLKQHLVIHTGERPFSCGVCEKRFTQSSALKVHVLIHSGEKPFKCDGCDKSFINNIGLMRHRSVHTKESPFRCELCNRCFTQSSSLKQHRLVHTGEKPFECHVCKKCFANVSNLKQHVLLVHVENKAFKCELCGKCFGKNSNLKRHLTKHKSVKRFECEVCGKCFSLNGSLKEHRAIHTGEKPFACKMCGKCFSRNSNLRRHRVVHNGDKVLTPV